MLSQLLSYLVSFLPSTTSPPPPSPTPIPPRDPPLTILSLPPELLHLISTHLPPSSLISLKLTTPDLYNTIALPPTFSFPTCTPCEKRAIRRALNERKHTLQSRRQCLGCNTLQHTRYFRSSSPLCALHHSLLTSPLPPPYLSPTLHRRIKTLAQRLPRSQPAVWISMTRTFCTHERHLLEWFVPRCNCRCETCAHIEVEAFVRVGRKGAVQVPGGGWGFGFEGEVGGGEMSKGRGREGMVEEDGWLDSYGYGEGEKREKRKRRFVPIMSLEEAEGEVDVLALSHRSLLTLL